MFFVKDENPEYSCGSDKLKPKPNMSHSHYN